MGAPDPFGPTVALYIPLQLLQLLEYIIIIIYQFYAGYLHIYTERNHVSRVYSIAVLCLQFVLLVMSFPCFVLYEVCVRCPMWLFSVVQ